ncbi:MAG: helix-turn-helix transcriptional regulator, partial [Bacteroidota bacterium]
RVCSLHYDIGKIIYKIFIITTFKVNITKMGKHQLGEFEEVVMLTVAILTDDAYGFAIIEEMEARLNRKVSIGALQTVLRRLEKKGYLSSELGEATNVRGGKRKRFFHLTSAGKDILQDTKEQRLGLWNAVPEFVVKFSH